MEPSNQQSLPSPIDHSEKAKWSLGLEAPKTIFSDVSHSYLSSSCLSSRILASSRRIAAKRNKTSLRIKAGRVAHWHVLVPPEPSSGPVCRIILVYVFSPFCLYLFHHPRQAPLLPHCNPRLRPPVCRAQTPSSSTTVSLHPRVTLRAAILAISHTCTRGRAASAGYFVPEFFRLGPQPRPQATKAIASPSRYYESPWWSTDLS